MNKNDHEKQNHLDSDAGFENSSETNSSANTQDEHMSFEKPGFLNLHDTQSPESDYSFLNDIGEGFSLNEEHLSHSDDVFDPQHSQNIPNFEPEDFSENQNNHIDYPSKKERKPLNIKVFIAILCSVCAVIGGVFGGLSAMLYGRLSNIEPSQTETESSFSDESGPTLPNEPEETLAGLEDLPTVPLTESSSAPQPDTVQGSLTASEIYANSVDTVVGISGTMLINNGIWGQSRAQVAGSGFIISQDGYIVTNAHVVNGVDDLSVTLYNKEKFPAEVIGMETSNDIAVIKINTNGLKSASWGDSESLVVGEELLIIGNPLGELTHTLTNGVVSALSRQIESESDVINMFQTNAAINSGNSGGPVFDMNGKVVGIATSKYASSSLEGLSFCIPANDVKGYIDDIIAYGYVKNRPLLGVSVQTITNTIASRYNMVLGAYVVAVGENSAAAKAGIVQSDVIVELNNQPISSVADLQGVLKQLRSGQSVPITVYRQQQRIDLNISMDEKIPANPRTSYTNVYDL